MTLEEAYAQLGLTPFDEYIERETQRNRTLGRTGPDEFRHIGASTWMCLTALLALDNGQDVLVLAETTKEVWRLRDDILKRANQLMIARPILGVPQLGRPPMEESTKYYTVGKGKLQWGRGGAGVVGAVGRRGKVFNNEEWKQRAIRRAKGPFAMVRRIVRKKANLYAAYAEGGEFLLDLTREGATQMVRANRGEIRTEGWQVQDPSFAFREKWRADLVDRPDRHDPPSDIFGK